MEVKIGVQHASRELVVDTPDDIETLEKLVREALEGDAVLTLTDTKGRRTLVPSERISYVEIGSGVTGQVGFRS